MLYPWNVTAEFSVFCGFALDLNYYIQTSHFPDVFSTKAATGAEKVGQ